MVIVVAMKVGDLVTLNEIGMDRWEDLRDVFDPKSSTGLVVATTITNYRGHLIKVKWLSDGRTDVLSDQMLQVVSSANW